MANNIVRVKPLLIRKRLQVNTPKNVSIIISPSRAKVGNLRDLNKSAAKPAKPVAPLLAQKVAPQPQPQAQARQTPVGAVARQKLIKSRRTVKKPTQVKYITREVNPESVGKVASIKNSGRGKLLIIIGNGPSILEADLTKLTNHPLIEVMSVNKPDRRLWPTKYWAFFDTSQFRRHEDLWNGYGGTIFNSTAIKRQKASSMQFKNLGGKGWSRDLMQGLTIGRSSVYASMQIAAWLGHEHVYIFGCDMNPEGIGGRLHFYGDNPDVSVEKRRESFKKEAVFYEHAASILNSAERAKFTFCSTHNKWPFVDHYGRMDHRVAVDEILSHAERLNKCIAK